MEAPRRVSRKIWLIAGWAVALALVSGPAAAIQIVVPTDFASVDKGTQIAGGTNGNMSQLVTYPTPNCTGPGGTLTGKVWKNSAGLYTYEALLVPSVQPFQFFTTFGVPSSAATLAGWDFSQAAAAGPSGVFGLPSVEVDAYGQPIPLAPNNVFTLLQMDDGSLRWLVDASVAAFNYPFWSHSEPIRFFFQSTTAPGSISTLGQYNIADGCGSSTINYYPGLASAGPDQTVNENTLVTLDGTKSVGANLPSTSFTWTQVTPLAPLVQLNGATTATPSFTAPELQGGFGSQTFTFQLTVTSGGVSDTAMVNIVDNNVNHPPVAIPTAPSSVNVGSTVTLAGDVTDPSVGLASYDPDGDPITYQWQQTGGPATVQLQNANSPEATFVALTPGVFTFTLTVFDGQLYSAPVPISVSVVLANHAPTASAGPPKTVDEGALVTLQGSGADPDGDALTYRWTQVGGPGVVLTGGSTQTASFVAPLYPAILAFPTDLTFTLTVTDPYGASAVASVVITVVDPGAPPDCSKAKADPDLLWPPNHKMREVRIKHVKDPEERFSIRIWSVTQDEPVNGLGDGDTSPDAVIKFGTDRDADGDARDTVLLRAERSGKGDGRVYRISFTAVDTWGGTCSKTVTVGVPHDAKQRPVDSGAVYDSTQP